MVSKRVTRRELHGLVWNRPMRELAAEFGISDVGLKKLCVRNDIVPPEQGHWQRIASGHKIPIPQLNSGNLDQVIDIYGADPVRELELPPEEHARLQALLEREEDPRFKIAVPVEPAPFHSITKSVQKILKSCKPDDYGCLRCDEVSLPSVRVTPQRLPRALALLDCIVRGAQQRGFGWRAGSGASWDASASLEVEGIPLTLGIFESVHRQVHRLTPEEKLKSYYGPRYDFLSTNQFSIRHTDYDTYLKDTPRQRLEGRLNELFIILINRAFKAREEKRKQEIRAAEAADREAKRAEIERLKRIEKAAIERLFTNAANWKKAQDLRLFIDAVENHQLDPQEQSLRTKWAEWARRHVAALDPLSGQSKSVLEVDFDALGNLDKLQRS
jgi:hypothetical protein